MAMFEIVLTREVTITVTVPAKDEQTAQEKALEYSDQHLDVGVAEIGKPKPAREWEHTETGDSIFVEAHDA
jgi:hypothetical protein